MRQVILDLMIDPFITGGMIEEDVPDFTPAAYANEEAQKYKKISFFFKLPLSQILFKRPPL